MGKTALITGAGSGSGRGIAKTLAAAGYDLILHTGTNEERANALAEELVRDFGIGVKVYSVDFTQHDGAKQLFEKCQLDRLDLFVNNAGVTMGAPIMELSDEVFDTVSNINWKNAYFCVKYAALHMKNTGTAGNIVLISSNMHAVNLYGSSIYSILKEALVKLTRHAALEFAQYGIRVNCIAPGYIDTKEERMEVQKEKSLKEIPLKRWVQPSEIGEWILFLTSPAAASFTGDTIELDGGARIMSGSFESYGL